MSLEIVSACIAGASVIVSALFSGLLYKATLESTKAAIKSADSSKNSADTALESLRISARIEDQKTQFNRALREQYIHELREYAFEITGELGAILNQKYSTSTYFNREIRMPIPTHHMAECFSNEDREIINSAWRNLNIYLFDYWERYTYSDTKHRKMKENMRDSDTQISDLRDVIIKFSAVMALH
ncbi:MULTISPECIES: hypothetical protein [unclassified Paenibacillus]|uniref:hypothetical protein n=1 Tax=unclassified Paenibacillus TaxID=185978 RepID=UPI002405B0F9|nr:MULTISPECIES: hypothetical protein [unclassified Paenibacillus]MDF9844170.1 hypothetical protein [Paenibacillus sp. PastF-2]MDF9850708.1 hypothetical protein [Paenibacillus sp. PastM-2]MDF9857279.1 hypothetical protein [Paenibacillus sp. PastF-1]MDH6482613.1 hypothetical protein [Paenibacillus sp. PastH-2]MDH6510040.1 hypothetical protein [Paenibacillus sp. PastM-3]